MGAEAVWVCHTCKTVCPRGGRSIFQAVQVRLTASSADYFKDMLERYHAVFELDDYGRLLDFLNDLRRWLERHETHQIHIGSDHSADGMDLDAYYDETVDGKVSSITRTDAQLQCFDAFEESRIREFEEIIKGDGTDREKAETLHNKFMSQLQ